MDLKLTNARGLSLALAAYSLFAGGVWIWRAGPTITAGGMAVLHGLLAGGLIVLSRRHQASRLRSDRPGILLAPWVLWFLAWTEIGWLYGAAPPLYHDQLVSDIDLAVFGTHLNHWLPQKWDGPLWREFMTASYLSYYALILGPPLWLALRGRRQAFWRHSAGMILTYLCAFSIYLLLPVQGPRDVALVHGQAGGLETAGYLPRIMAALFQAGDSSGTAFPSSHCAGAVAAALLCRHHFGPRSAFLFGLWAVLIVIATIHTNNHYAIDSLAGCALALVIHIKEIRHAQDTGHRRHRIHRPTPCFPTHRCRTPSSGARAGSS